MRSPLFLAAFEPELSAISGNKLAIGIGLVAASAGAALAIESRRPDAIVLVGTCGAYPGSGLAIGDLVVASRIGLASSAEARAQGALLPSMAASLETDHGTTAELAALGARSASVATTLAITTDDELARALRSRYGFDVEHLEAFAVAAACQAASVPFACVLGVTNDVGARGRGQWRDNRERVEASVGALVSRWSIKNPS